LSGRLIQSRTKLASPGLSVMKLRKVLQLLWGYNSTNFAFPKVNFLIFLNCFNEVAATYTSQPAREFGVLVLGESRRFLAFLPEKSANSPSCLNLWGSGLDFHRLPQGQDNDDPVA
jgi:hypothetical protein